MRVVRPAALGTIALIVLLVGAALAIASDGATVPSSGTITVTGPDGVCKTIKNASATGLSEYVPTASVSEWQNFVAHPPAGVTLGGCNQTINNTAKSGHNIYPPGASPGKYCMEQGYTYGLYDVSPVGTIGQTYTESVYLNNAWTTVSPTFFRPATAIYCFTASSYQDYSNPTQSGKAVASSEVDANRYCQQLGWQIGGSISDVSWGGATSDEYYKGGAWHADNPSSGSGWSRIKGMNKLSVVRCMNLASVQDYTNPKPSGQSYSLCLDQSDEDTWPAYYEDESNVNAFCQQKGYAAGVWTDTPATSKSCAGTPSACGYGCTYRSSGAWVTVAISNGTSVRCFK